MSKKDIMPTINVRMDEYGRILIDDESFLSEIAGASAEFIDPALLNGGCSNSGCGSNASCSNTGC